MDCVISPGVSSLPVEARPTRSTASVCAFRVGTSLRARAVVDVAADIEVASTPATRKWTSCGRNTTSSRACPQSTRTRASQRRKCANTGSCASRRKTWRRMKCCGRSSSGASEMAAIRGKASLICMLHHVHLYTVAVMLISLFQTVQNATERVSCNNCAELLNLLNVLTCWCNHSRL